MSQAMSCATAVAVPIQSRVGSWAAEPVRAGDGRDRGEQRPGLDQPGEVHGSEQEAREVVGRRPDREGHRLLGRDDLSAAT